MPNLKWYLNRLRAMSAAEISWRVSQKMLQKKEKRAFAAKPKVTDRLFYSKEQQPPAFNRLFLGEELTDILLAQNPSASVPTVNDWNDGWPLLFSYEIDYKSSPGTADARASWEPNRHFRFPELALRWVAESNEPALEELADSFDRFNSQAPFLWGIAWTSVMEVAIRAVQWMVTLSILSAPEAPEPSSPSLRQRLPLLKEQLAVGACNMIEYVMLHYSRFSSANNHLLVEMAAALMAGAAFNRADWISTASAVLDRELALQNSIDGVNRESSLHYHAFVMEAYALSILAMEAADRAVPKRWVIMLNRMAAFLADSFAGDNAVCEFGDNDAGMILPLADIPSDDTPPTGNHNIDTYRRILRLASFATGENEATPSPVSKTYATGGYSFLKANGIFVGIDHAEHGFGSIAAHAHCDELSFQLFFNGQPVFIDSGTSPYHGQGNRPERDRIRSAAAHNALVINETEPATVLGAFMWGEQPVTELNDYSPLSLMATTMGASRVAHQRSFTIDPQRLSLTIADSLSADSRWTASLITQLPCKILSPKSIELEGVATVTTENGTFATEDATCYPAYASPAPCTRITLNGSGAENRITVNFLKKD